MTKVYVIFCSDWEDSEVVGAYLDKDKAIERAKYLNTYDKDWGNHIVQEWDIAEQKFDEIYSKDME